MKRRRGERVSYGVVAAAIATALAVIATRAPAALAQAPPNVLVLEDDGTLLDPAQPLSLAGTRVRFVPAGSGAYVTTVASLRDDAASWRSGSRLALGESTGPERVALPARFPFFGALYDQIFVHPHGTVSFGEPLGTRASAAASGELLRSLNAGPAAVSALWNELLPSRAASAGGVFVSESEDRVSIAWVEVPSVRPVDEPNTFRIVLHSDGRIDLEYGAVASRWGLAGVTPGAKADRVTIADLAGEPSVSPGQAVLGWYRDLPSLNEIGVARATYARLPDRFQFLSVFTTEPVDASNLVASHPVKNPDRGIGLPVFDHGSLFGTQNLEHIVVMNHVGFYDDDPNLAPRHPAYAFAPSTLAVLAHEAGHRWLSDASCPAGSLATSDGHWSFFLDSGGSLLGGNSLRDNGDGSFTTLEPLQGFGPLDQYLMGVRPAAEVEPFFMVDAPEGFEPSRSRSGRPFDGRARPEAGVRFRGRKVDVTVSDVIEVTGERVPPAGRAPRAFRMAFVLVVPRGSASPPGALEKVESVRRAFGPYFEAATGGRARMGTTLPTGVEPASPAQEPALRAGEPRVLSAEVRPRGPGRVALKLEFADFDADLATVELATDGVGSIPITAIDVTTAASGSRQGALTVTLRGISQQAREIRLTLVDRRGQRSATITRPVPSRV